MPVALLILVAAAAAAVVVVVTSGSGSDEPAEVPTDESVVPAVESSDSPLVAPIDDATDVVGRINDNGAETELLQELGLDPEGNPLPDGD